MLGIPGFEFESSQDVLAAARGPQDAQQAMVQGALGNATRAAIRLGGADAGQPASASIYQLDGIVRRAPSLQLTTDARRARLDEEVAA
jgi:NADH-quinone oxidoreductase subunit G